MPYPMTESGQIYTPDARNKQQIGAIPDGWLDAWGDVRHVGSSSMMPWRTKGEHAHWPVRYIVQEIRDAFEA